MQDSRPADLPSGARVGHYTIVRPLGRGGMGIVYVARDERLEREVALKTIGRAGDEELRARLWREARAAAAVSHPHICQVFDIDDTPHGIVLAMELLDGESLDARLRRGPLPPDESARVAGAMLAALGVLHERGLVHRDIKPSNVFLTPHGPKLLDFGLARRVFTPSSLDTVAEPGLTGAGMLVGTPQYMAPEQVRGAGVDNRTDVYAVGALLFHMLTGRPPFEAANIADALVAAIHEQPPALQGPPSVVAMDRIIRRAMQKDPEERYQTAASMARALASVETASESSRSASIPVRALTRLVVSPVRIARPDPEVSFLSMGLAEAVSGSLASLGNIVVRAPAVARALAEEGADPRRLAAAADVDLVLSSVLLRSGPSLRVTVQLIDVTSGTLLGSAPVTGTMDDIFAVEDAMVLTSRQLLGEHRPGLVPASGRHPTSTPHAPATARAFDLFLRGIEHARHLDQIAMARDLFEQAVAEDPDFAPAWAALGRCHRVYGKYFGEAEASVPRAQEAFRRALTLAPHLPAAHRYLTHLESERGHSTAAIERLLQHATVNRNDALLFAGLVHACRYAGLINASLSADREAHRLDPNVDTSVDYTALHAAETQADLEHFSRAVQTTDTPHGVLAAMAITGPHEQFQAAMAQLDLSRVPPHYRLTIDAMRSSVLSPGAESRAIVERSLAAHSDPEATFIGALCLFKMGERTRGLEVLESSVAAGYSPARMLARHAIFDEVRDEPRFKALGELLGVRTREATDVFERGGGREMLGVTGDLT